MRTRETVDRLFEEMERHTSRPLDYPMDIREVVTILTGLGYWATPQALNHAAHEGAGDLPDDFEHISQMVLTENQVKAMACFLEVNEQWSPLDPRHDHKRDHDDLRNTREIRKELLAIKRAAERLNPVEVVDLVTDETNPYHRYILCLVVRSELQQLQNKLARKGSYHD